MPEPLRSEAVLGKQLLRMQQTSSPPRSWMSIRMNDGLSLLVPCLKAFSISEMNSSGATGVGDGSSGSETPTSTWRGRRMRISSM